MRRAASALCLALFLCATLGANDLNSSRPKDRIKAVRQLAKQGSDAIPQLLPVLSDSDREVRLEVVRALSQIGTQRSLDPLIQATRDNDGQVQSRAVDGLVNFYLPGYLRTGLTGSFRRLSTAIQSRFTDTNDQAIDWHVQVRPDVIEALGKVARGGNGFAARARAARALGILRGKAALADLAEALRSRNAEVIYEALVALQKIRDLESVSLVGFLLRDLDDRVQIAALETVGVLQGRQFLPQVREALDRARSNRVRIAALGSLAMLPDAANRDSYARFFVDKDDDLRAAAAEGYARLKNPADLPALQRAFAEETKSKPRLSLAFAISSLGELDLAAGAPLRLLVDTLNDNAYRRVARTFLIELSRSAEVRRLLAGTAVNEPKPARMELALIFGSSAERDLEPALDALSRDPDTDVAQEASRALRNLRALAP